MAGARQCEICKKDFVIYPYRLNTARFCSNKCRGSWLSRIKWTPPRHKGEILQEWRLKMSIAGKKKVWTPEHKRNISVAKTGKPRPDMERDGNWNWLGGKSFEPYPISFNQRLKNLIRQRDNYRCQECGWNESRLNRRLHIHHIDYNKNNCDPVNLISLCTSCHAQTNYRRNDWTKYFAKKVRVYGGVA